MARTCVFCGGTGKMSAEHVFPQWSREYLREVEGKGTHTRKILHGDGRISARSHKADPATATVKTVCASCNNGWMSRLESEAMPFLLSMIKGHRRTYYDAGKALIARWTPSRRRSSRDLPSTSQRPSTSTTTSTARGNLPRPPGSGSRRPTGRTSTPSITGR